MSFTGAPKSSLRLAIVVSPHLVHGQNCVKGVARCLREKYPSVRVEIIIYRQFESFEEFKEFDGILLTQDSALWAQLPSNIPVVSIGFSSGIRPGFGFEIRDRQVGIVAAEALCRFGVISYGFYHGWHRNTNADIENGNRRLDGFRTGFEQGGNKYVGNRFSVQRSSSFDKLVDWLSNLPKPAGVLAYNDVGALKVAEACWIAGLKIPDEVAIVGVDNDPLFCGLGDYGLSSVDPDVEQVAYNATEYLIGYLGENESTAIEIGDSQPTLVSRQSTGNAVSSSLVVSRALDLMYQTDVSALGSIDIPRLVGTSQRGLEMLFKKELGITIQNQINNVQLDYVKRLLRETALSVEEIAEKIGWEPPTIYRAFRRSLEISPGEYRRQFHEEALETSSGRAISVDQRKYVVGVISSMSGNAHVESIKGFKEFFRDQSDFHLLLCLDSADAVVQGGPTSLDGEKSIADCDAYIVLGQKREFLRRLTGDKPVITTQPRLEGEPCLPIAVDERSAGVLAANHFLHKKFTHFAYCSSKVQIDKTGTEMVNARSPERYSGFRDTLLAAGVPEENILSINYSSRLEMIRGLESLPPRTALYAFNDHIALTLQKECFRLGIRVPEDVALLGTDNDKYLCQMAKPTLSSVEIGFRRAGFKIAESFVSWIKNQDEPNLQDSIVLARQVVERDSTRILGIDDSQIESVVEFLRNHYKEYIGVQDIAASVGLSRRSIEKRFKANLGRTIGEELQYTRLQAAADLLTSTSLSVGEVAHRCGYKKPSHFCRVFKEQMGAPPLTYKAPRRKE